MIAMLKNETNCNIFIGQNGRVWITGKDKDLELAVKAILKIEKESHVSGLTDRLTRFLKEEKGKKEKEPGKEHEHKEETRTEEKIEDKTEENVDAVEEEKQPEEHEKAEEKKSGGILDELLGDEK
jgi:exosome complex component RRP4